MINEQTIATIWEALCNIQVHFDHFEDMSKGKVDQDTMNSEFRGYLMRVNQLTIGDIFKHDS